jgi:L-amino acid N-acyltransferase YncA
MQEVEYAVVLVMIGQSPRMDEKVKPTLDIAKGAYATELSLITGGPEEYYRLPKEDEHGTMYCLAVDRKDNVLGFILLETEDRTRTLWTSHVYVRPEVRKKGVYSMMMKRVLKFAKDCKFNRVFSLVHRKNWPSQQAHKSAGFKKSWVGYEIPMENGNANS